MVETTFKSLAAAICFRRYKPRCSLTNITYGCTQ